MRPRNYSEPTIAEPQGVSSAGHRPRATQRLSQSRKEIGVPDTGRDLHRGGYQRHTGDKPSFPVLSSKSADAQQRIESQPDENWEWKQTGEPPILQKAGHLLLTAGQRTTTARLTAVAADEPYVGQGWMPVTGLEPKEAKAAAVFLNSTVGRLLILRHPSKTLEFPAYTPATHLSLSIPDLTDPHILSTLADCWEATRTEIVPQYRDGYTTIRRRWDTAVCTALNWNPDEVSELGELLAREPHVRGVAYGQWKA